MNGRAAPPTARACPAAPKTPPALLCLALLTLLGASAAAAPRLEMDCRLDQPEYLAEAAIPLRLFLTARDTPAPIPFLVHADYPRLGARSCFKLRCWGPDGVELPNVLTPMPSWMEEMVVPQQTAPGGAPWSVRIDLAAWFRPPAGGPYRVEALYEWTGNAAGKPPNWVGRTNAASARFTVRELNYGPLAPRRRARLDDLLELLKQPQTRAVARDELAALGPPALTALHDALAMGHLPRRAALIEVLAAIGDDASLLPIIAANAGPTDAVPRAKERALVAYGPRAAPAVIEGMKRGLPDALPLAIRLGPAAVGPLIELVQRADPALERTALPAACLALGQIGDARALPALEQLAATRPALRRIATLAARNIAEPKAALFR
jgi:hypothetical protein